MKHKTGGTGWPSCNILDLPMYVMSHKIFEKVQKKLGEGSGMYDLLPNNFGGKYGASNCNQWGLCGVVILCREGWRPGSSKITL